ncbi:hypothetical protein ACI78V_18745 [Geodermatophilus sp. SYSU D00742]
MIAGPLTLLELTEVVAAVCRRGSTPPPAAADPVPAGNCLGLPSAAFDRVVAELERRFHLPLQAEARWCRTPVEFVALVNTQVTSGV